MSVTQKIKRKNNPRIAAAPLDQSQRATFALWLLVTTNPALLLGPAKTAMGAHTAVKLSTEPSDAVQTLSDLATALRASNPSEALFTEAMLNSFLTTTLSKPVIYDDGTSGAARIDVLL